MNTITNIIGRIEAETGVMLTDSQRVLMLTEYIEHQNCDDEFESFASAWVFDELRSERSDAP